MRFPRLHLVELEDLPALPSFLRDYATDYLEYMSARLRLKQILAPLLAEALADSGTTRIVDLGSGAGGPVAQLCEQMLSLGLSPKITLTDRFPNIPAWRALRAAYPSNIEYVDHPVDAAEIPANLRGLRTLFNSFHHLRPAEARAVLARTVEDGQPVLLAEISERSLRMLLLVMLTPLYVAWITPSLRPFRWSRLLLTYVLPVVPFLCWFDGVVSQLRAYTEGELIEMTKDLAGFDWQVYKRPAAGGLARVTILAGSPAVSACTETSDSLAHPQSFKLVAGALPYDAVALARQHESAAAAGHPGRGWPGAAARRCGLRKDPLVTHRIAYLIQERQVSADNILAVTFTNKAAKEMAERVDRIMGHSSLAKPTLSTFHSSACVCCGAISRRCR